jgi:hypothetical protein
LQKGDAASEAAQAPAELHLVDLSSRIHDLADTAAIIDSLDLVITICTSVAHLAGALAKPVWTLLAQPADWRWMEHCEDTPWYPTMRLFRQNRQGDWSGVVEEASRLLAAVTRDRRQLTVQARTSSGGASDSLDGCITRSPNEILCRVAATRYGMLQFRPDGTAASRSIEWYGEYRQRQLNFLANTVEQGMIVVDVASGSGFDSRFFASALGDAGHLFMLESRATHVPLLENNLHANSVSNATVIRIPLAGADVQPMTASREGSVEYDLDDLSLPRFQLLKINDGFNAVRVLRGAAKCLWQFRPAIAIFSMKEAAVQEAKEAVTDFGYQTMRFDFPLFDSENFNARRADVFDGQIAFALFALPEERDMRTARIDWNRLAS